MMDTSKIDALISNVENALTELKTAVSGTSENPESQEAENMETHESDMPMGKAKNMMTEEEEQGPPDIVKRMAGMR